MSSKLLLSLSALALTASVGFAQSADVAGAPASAPQIINNGTPAPAATTGSYAALLHDNGGFVTNPGGGFGGADASVVQVPGTVAGQNWSKTAIAGGYRVCDDFTVPAGKQWVPTTLKWFGYQTGSTTASTYTQVSVQIWTGTGGSGPNGTSTIVAGDLTTNRLVSGTWSNCYRVFTAADILNTQRPVMELSLDVSSFPPLPAGTYWLELNALGSLASGPWSPAKTPSTGGENALQWTGASYVAVQDGGGAFTQDYPFKLEGTELNAPIVYCTAKINALGCTPSISAAGVPSATSGSGFTITSVNMRNNKVGIMFYGNTGQAASPFTGGFLCLNGPLRRVQGLNTGGTLPPANDCSGVFSVDMNLFAVGGLGGNPNPFLLVPGTTVNCQYWGRDPGFAAPDNTQLSDGLEYIIGA